MCPAIDLVPSSCYVSQMVTEVSDRPFSRSGFSDIWTGTVDGQKVAIKALRIHGDNINAVKQFSFMVGAHDHAHLSVEQAYLRELVIWKCLRHPNIVPFFGTSSQFEVSFVSEWMPGGTVTAFLRRYPDYNRSFFVRERLYDFDSQSQSLTYMCRLRT